MKEKTKLDALNENIDLLMNELKCGKYPSAYELYQYLYDIKKELPLASNSEIEHAFTEASPILIQIIDEIKQLKDNKIISSIKLALLLKQGYPIISQCRTRLNFSQRESPVKKVKILTLQIIRGSRKLNSRYNLEKIAYIATIIGAIATTIGVIIAYIYR